MKLENKLKLARVAQGDLTQQDLADKVGCSRQTIHSIESGKFVPSVELALKIAKILNSKVEDIFYFSGELS
ncbi:MAG TPA: helix-turn-helix transcriptional regulator [Bdellovibrio sp.]|uniref:helix-turn-helix transcriptional regulator n=1 Tax=Bdellovibrio sp. TaxID=28201 RepID=UPI002F1D3563